jgi:site-specific recombinase XerD
VSLGAAVDLFLAAKAAEGASPRTVEWYRMIVGRAVWRFGAERSVECVGAAELRAWLLELRDTLSPESIAGYVQSLKAFGNWCAVEELAAAAGFRGLRRPRVPRKLIAPFTDAELQRLLALAEPRERALVLLLLDSGLRLAEVAGLHVADLCPDGTIRVLGKGSLERIVPIGATARRPSSATSPSGRSSGRPMRCSWVVADR